jgi:DHA1 family bicyclomycin/chloramphenicol resistance-like MFS transporter
VFIFLTALGLVLLIASYRFLHESLPRESRIQFHPATLAATYWAAIGHPQFLARSLAVGFAFGGLGLYISSAASFVINILHLHETAFAWLFVPMIGGMVLGAALGAKLAHRVKPTAVLRYGFACMAIAAVANLGYNRFFSAAVPWAVLPVMLYTFGLGLSMPGMSLMTLDLFPKLRGLAASLLNFVQMLIFSLISGIVAPMLFDSAFKLAAGIFGCYVLAAVCWRIGTWPIEKGQLAKQVN